jgi:diaminobutyrate-2-oxoglutarate transaminase
MVKHAQIFAQLESRVRSYPRAFPAVFDRARGAEVWDAAGRRYLDFLAGAGALNYGHNNPVLKDALIDYVRRDAITHSLDLHTVAKAEFLEAFRDIVLLPRRLEYVVQFTGPTGTNAVEAAFKVARKISGRSSIIHFTNSFHGVSMGALSATGSQHLRKAAGLPLFGTTALPYDGYLGQRIDTVDYLDRLLADPSSGVPEPAAVILEIVQGEGGLNVASTHWLRRLQALCHERRILLIVDDIQTGCGRTGTFFSFEAAGLTPDVITLSKSLSGYGLPLSVVLIRRDLDVWEPGEHNGTFRGNNHAFVTGTAMLRHYWRTQAFAEAVQAKGDHLDRRLRAMVQRFPAHLLDARGRGMMRGVRCAHPEQAAHVTAMAFERGLVIERCGPRDEVIKCMMPLTIGQAELDEGLDILERAMAEVFEEKVVEATAAVA